MFTNEQREFVRERVLELVRADPRVEAGAITGSMAVGAEDEWSDVDLAFGIAAGSSLEAVLQDWTEAFNREFGVVQHFDLHAGPSIYRVFLLAGGGEVDVGVTPADEFGARGPRFRALFGTPRQLEAPPPPNAQYLIGLCWHHVLHARSCIERGKSWQAEYWISALRDHALELSCIRLGEESAYGRGMDRLPGTLTAPLAAALVRSLDAAELRRALAAATKYLIGELAAWDAALCARLTPILQEFGTSSPSTDPDP